MNRPSRIFRVLFGVLIAGHFLSCAKADRVDKRDMPPYPTPATSRPIDPPQGNTPMIVMKRGENAFGSGPVFTISVFGDGRVEYVPGQDHPMPIYKPEKPNPSPTPSNRVITRSEMDDIMQHLGSIGFLSMNGRYVDTTDGCPHVVSDQSTITITVNTRSGEQKTITHYQGCVEDPSFVSSVFPRSLKELEAKIMSLSQ